MSTETKEVQNVRLRAEVYGKMLHRFTESANDIIRENGSFRRVRIDLNGYEINFSDTNGRKMRRFYTHDENPIVKTVITPKKETKANTKAKAKVPTKENKPKKVPKVASTRRPKLKIPRFVEESP